jgi:hypothetical protein
MSTRRHGLGSIRLARLHIFHASDGTLFFSGGMDEYAIFADLGGRPEGRRTEKTATPSRRTEG